MDSQQYLCIKTLRGSISIQTCELIDPCASVTLKNWTPLTFQLENIQRSNFAKSVFVTASEGFPHGLLVIIPKSIDSVQMLKKEFAGKDILFIKPDREYNILLYLVKCHADQPLECKIASNCGQFANFEDTLGKSS